MTSYDTFASVLASKEGHVLTVSLNRPAQRNAINAEVHESLRQILALAAADDEVRVIVLRGEGKAFCAGGDVNTMEGAGDGPGPSPALTVRSTLDAARMLDMLLAVPQPIVCAVHGFAMGLGATIALLCDVVVMAEDAQIADTHVNIGLVAGDGGAVLWPLLAPLGAVKWSLLTGERISGVEAARLGLALKAVPAAELDAEAQALAGRLAQLAPLAVRGTKETLNRIIRDRINLVLDTGLLLEGATFVSEDHREAVSAFMAKRPATFVGR
ncbi:MAG TPA: enoyl-CoA hydratase/isomerase family protein [Caulobacteraceae bacterium]|jgi:enoyl-CoA hydratase|nr:enoyl-CoA hydratase/isomerase family protein [Caulobacteraceae bacterium]